MKSALHCSALLRSVPRSPFSSSSCFLQRRIALTGLFHSLCLKCLTACGISPLLLTYSFRSGSGLGIELDEPRQLAVSLGQCERREQETGYNVEESWLPSCRYSIGCEGQKKTNAIGREAGQRVGRCRPPLVEARTFKAVQEADEDAWHHHVA
eukprot:scaffold492_cov257-Pinguiococcus_pyrenoidosus.AAC.51